MPHIVLNIMIFLTCVTFSNLSSKFWSKDPWFDPCYPCFKDSVKKKKIFQIFIKQESRIEWFVPYCPFNNLNKFLTNPPNLFCFKSKQVVWSEDNAFWSVAVLSFIIILMIFTKNFILISSLSSNTFCSKDNTVWPLQIILNFVNTETYF